MRTPLPGLLCLALTMSGTTLARAQSQGSVDLLTLSLESLKAGRSVRVFGAGIGAGGVITGSVVEVRNSALWLNGASTPSVPLVSIDSVLVSHTHSGTGAIVGSLLGVVVGAIVLSHQQCNFLDSSCMTGAELGYLGIVLGGTAIGAGIGAGIKTWERRYP